MAESNVLLQVRSVSKSFGGIKALNEVTFDVNRHEIVGLIGPNGAGKTTLFNTITGFFQPDTGSIIFKGRDTSHLSICEIARMGIGRTFQITRPFTNLTTLENLMIGCFWPWEKKIIKTLFRSPRDLRDHRMKLETKAEQLLDFVGLILKKTQLVSNLQFVERKKLEIARAMMLDPEIILLDEPSSGLNPVELEEQSNIVRSINEKMGVTVVIVEHIMKFLMNISTKVVVLDGGVKIAEGTPQEICTNSRVCEVYLGTETEPKS